MSDVTPSPFDNLPLPDLEEVCGELHRRLGAALRRIGEARADRGGSDPAGPGREPPRWLTGELVAAFELAIATLAAHAAGGQPPSGRIDQTPSTVAALLYGAPTLGGLLGRLDQDRRVLASLARRLEERLDGDVDTPWGRRSLRSIVTLVTIEESARCAQEMEQRAEAIEAHGLA